MHRGVQWPEPRLKWPDGKLVCCTFRIAYEAFRKSGKFKKTKNIEVNVETYDEYYGDGDGETVIVERNWQVCEQSSSTWADQQSVQLIVDHEC